MTRNRTIMMMTTNLALHPNKQFRNPAGGIDRVKCFLEDFGDGRCVCREGYMRAKSHIKAIEVRDKF